MPDLPDAQLARLRHLLAILRPLLVAVSPIQPNRPADAMAAMIAADLRRQYRAARTVYLAEQRAPRIDAALATLEPLAGPEPVTVPGYRLWRGPDGTLHTAPVPPIDAAQLALWRELAQDRPEPNTRTTHRATESPAIRTTGTESHA